MLIQLSQYVCLLLLFRIFLGGGVFRGPKSNQLPNPTQSSLDQEIIATKSNNHEYLSLIDSGSFHVCRDKHFLP